MARGKFKKVKKKGDAETPSPSPSPAAEQEHHEAHFSEFTLVEHVEELRFRLMWSLLAVVVLAIVAWTRVDDIKAFITQPYTDLTHKKLMVVAPMEAFLANLKIAFTAGLVAACPVWLYQAWRFVAPGLYGKERRTGLMLIPVGSVLFVAGCAFGHFLVAPMALQFFVGQGEGFEITFTLERYMSFMLNFVLSFGAAFEMPIVMVGLVSLGILSPKTISGKRGYVYIILATLGAVLTPGADILSMLLLWIPLTVLFEGTMVIILIFRIGKAHWDNPLIGG